MIKLEMLLLFLLPFTLISCGAGNQFCKDNYDKLNGFCYTLVGYDKDYIEEQNKQTEDIKDLKRELADANRRLDMLRYSFYTWADLLYKQINELNENQNEIVSLIFNNTNDIYLIRNQLYSLNAFIASTLGTLAGIQEQLNYQQYEIVNLQTANNPPTEIIDFCGDTPGMEDEVGIRLSSREIVVVDKLNGKYNLTILQPGNYETKDNTDCHFTITNDLEVIW